MQNPPAILVIDDEPNNFDVIDALLDSEEYQLSYVSNAKDARNFLELFQPDVILLDVMMPHESGIEFCQKFKSHPQWRHIPVIMVTALTAKEDLLKCFEVGADDFISKPVNGIELRSRVRSMLRIKQQYDSLQETLRLREDLSNMLVHDLRNPLTAILLSATILQVADYTPERQKQKTNQILTSTQRLQSMIDNLLMMAKLESGKMILQKTDVDICDLCDSAITDMGLMASQNQIQLVPQLPQPGRIINIDPVLVRRVIDNLLSNAIKFSPPDSQVILCAYYPSPGRVIIQVMDSGKGVKEELQQIIFEKYEVGTFFKGTSQIGLGLAFCKMVVDAHGGSIQITNNQPTGATFTVEILG